MKIKNILTLSLLVLLFASCADRLEVSDPDSLSPESVLDEVGGFESVLLSAYNRLINFGNGYGQNAFVAPAIMADQLDFFNRTGRYETQYVNAVRAHMGRWGRYIGINDANIIISKIDRLREDPTADADLIDLYKGEALFIRALHYHDLAKVYGYEPGQEVNGFNLTVPLRLTATDGVSDAFNVSARATNTELYQQIESDLQAAIGLLPDVHPSGPYRAGAAAAHGLLARVYLYWGRWADAAAQAEMALTKTPASLVETKAGYYDSWSAIPHPESVFEIEIRSTDWSTVDGANNSLNSLSNNIYSGGQFILVASTTLVDVMQSEPGDFRDTIFRQVDGIPDGTRLLDKWRGEKGDFLENIPFMRVSELYLIAAEGYARSGNEGQAQEMLNILRTARGLSETSATGAALTDLILKERQVELALEGHRWYDLKRLGMGIPKSPAANVPDLSYSDFRLLAPLSESDLTLNEMLVQNPGY
ncbi:RagB/SusD family nutrient uptake outer membrane protein [Flavilitoribacter nigricans]|uniref:RagB/SusD family nutrient uptake outer membrane protein n=1 Tax=Flavilitoribacter nigricans (strain ATCC 23147 / DSM 23189 / NBRC 102662 / NCIMB 1420 / SS-2) TaxID=1122177 RepID=A0A2D0N7S1_FLAN2|nr:RagB/SusD family nutrient uptake outer membrane protein [Flavilitoribacter nigricans]PHN03803.1 RagB/SusD family nutrient uptake outer membrane protein [Flavilitoribacter nigricans DSM 23189 = NBRC 102662]